MSPKCTKRDEIPRDKWFKLPTTQGHHQEDQLDDDDDASVCSNHSRRFYKVQRVPKIAGVEAMAMVVMLPRGVRFKKRISYQLSSPTSSAAKAMNPSGVT